MCLNDFLNVGFLKKARKCFHGNREIERSFGHGLPNHMPIVEKLSHGGVKLGNV